MSVSDKAVEAAAKVLRDEGGEPGHSIHSWRCEHPDRFGECDCVRETARIMLIAAAPYLDGTECSPAVNLDRAEEPK